MTSLISLICWSRPPIMSYVLSGTFSTIIRETRGSTEDGSIFSSLYESDRRVTRLPTVSLDMSTLSDTSTTLQRYRQWTVLVRYRVMILTIFTFWMYFHQYFLRPHHLDHLTNI